MANVEEWSVLLLLHILKKGINKCWFVPEQPKRLMIDLLNIEYGKE